jgi:hypothetical protein
MFIQAKGPSQRIHNHNTDISVEREINLEKRMCEIIAQNPLFFCPALNLWLGISIYFHKLFAMHGKARSGYISETFANIPHEERFKTLS